MFVYARDGVFRRRRVTFGKYFTGKAASTTNHCWCQKTRAIALSHGIKISTVHHFVLSNTRLWQTDGIATAITCIELHAPARQKLQKDTAGCLTDQQVWFQVDFQKTFSWKFSRICNFIDIYWAGSLTRGITLILFTEATAQLKDIYRGLIAPISINHGLLQDVLLVYCKVQEFWVSQKISRRLC